MTPPKPVDLEKFKKQFWIDVTYERSIAISALNKLIREITYLRARVKELEAFEPKKYYKCYHCGRALHGSNNPECSECYSTSWYR